MAESVEYRFDSMDVDGEDVSILSRDDQHGETQAMSLDAIEALFMLASVRGPLALQLILQMALIWVDSPTDANLEHLTTRLTEMWTPALEA